MLSQSLKRHVSHGERTRIGEKEREGGVVFTPATALITLNRHCYSPPVLAGTELTPLITKRDREPNEGHQTERHAMFSRTRSVILILKLQIIIKRDRRIDLSFNYNLTTA